jgi:hypothetical protein
MKPDDIVYEWIDRYLKGQLEGEELSAFIHKIESDVDFSTLVQNQKAANAIIVGNRLAMVKQQMDADFKASDTKNRAKWGLGGVLGVSVLICSIVYLSDTTAPIMPSNKRLIVQQRSIHVSSSTLEKASVESASKQLHKNTIMPVAIDTVRIKTFPSEIHQSSGFDNNTISDQKNRMGNNVNQSILDTFAIKNHPPNINKNVGKADICSGVTIEAILTTEAACSHKTDGEIHINEKSMRGGQYPYMYILINTSNDTVRQKTSSFVSLAAGQYILIFKDANSCLSIYKKPLFVNEKSCKQAAQSFNPHAGERFNYPVSDQSDAQIIIYNRGGQSVYKTNVLKGESQFWDGTNQNGQILPTGMYIYIIEYVSGIKETGEVVIF